MYNETLHDRTASFLYQNIGNTKLSEGSIAAIRRMFPEWCDLYKYIQENIDMDCVDRWKLMDQIYPEIDQDD